MDFGLASQRLIICARGRLNQSQFSKDLGFKFNVVNRWENGTRIFYWEDFLKIAGYKNWPVLEALNRVTGYKVTSKDPSEVLRTILPLSSQSLLSGKFSLQKLARIRSGKTKLQFRDFLEILETAYIRSERFLYCFVDLSSDPILSNMYDPGEAYRHGAVNDVLLMQLKSTLEVGTYLNRKTHSSELLAKMLNTSVQKIDERLKFLVDAKVVRINECGKFVVTSNLIDAGARNNMYRQLIRNQWRNEIIDYTKQGNVDRERFQSAYLVYTSNKELDEKIFRLSSEFYAKISALTDSVKNKDTDRLSYFAIDLYRPFLPVKDRAQKPLTNYPTPKEEVFTVDQNQLNNGSESIDSRMETPSKNKPL